MSFDTSVSFGDLGLSSPILSALSKLGFVHPTPIQAKAIPVILESSRDLLGFAQTGTGKTAAFSLPVLEKLDPNLKQVQALVLCPTRELCLQITRDMEAFSKDLPGLNVVAVYGGSSVLTQVRALQRGTQIVVGTPGRVTDMVKRGKLRLENLSHLVLDEADEMLDQGFKDDLDTILDSTPEEKQTLLFSATMSPWIEKVASQRMHDPVTIKTASQNKGADTVSHQYVMVHARDRYAALRRLLDVNPDVYGIVFCRTRRQTKEVAAKLMADHYSAEAIHGEIAQNERTRAMDRFRKKRIQILVATDVAARGIDVNDLTHVINYELPDSPETYVHRSGRTGRAGKEGVSLTIINMRERGRLKRIEGIMKKKFESIPVPTGKAICEAQLMSLVHRIKETPVDTEGLAPYLPSIFEELHGLTVEELISKFVSVEFNRFLDHYSNIKDISVQKERRNDYDDWGYGGGRRGRDGHRGSRDRRGGRDGRRGGRDDRRGSRGQRGGAVLLRSYSIELGKKDGFGPKALFSLINKNQSLKGIEIGGIHVKAQRTEFEADARHHDKLLRFLGREEFKGQKLGLRGL